MRIRTRRSRKNGHNEIQWVYFYLYSTPAIKVWFAPKTAHRMLLERIFRPGRKIVNVGAYSKFVNPICTGGGKFAPPFSYFNIAPKRKQSFALMHPDFESNLITHIFRKFGVSRTTGSDVIFAFVKGT